MIKAIIFDADGTFYGVKTARAYQNVVIFLESCTGIGADKILTEWKNTIQAINSSVLDVKDPQKRSRSYSLAKTLEALGLCGEKPEQLIDESLDIFWKTAMEDLEFSPFCLTAIKELKKKYILVVASEEFRENLILKLNHVFGGWEKYFEFLITPENTGTMKPSEKYYIEAMRRLGLSSDEVISIGDSQERDVAPAEKLGIKAMVFTFDEMDSLLEKIKKLC